MPTVVKSNLFALVNQLELKNNRRYTYKYIGDKLGYSHQAVKNILSNGYSPDNYIKYGLISKLLDFFAAEGMPIAVSDLFTVTASDNISATDIAALTVDPADSPQP